MIDYREDADTGVVELTVEGTISRTEFDDVAAKLEARIRDHGKVRLLENVKRFDGIAPALFWDDMRFALRHLNDFSRCAVVGDKAWLEWLTKAVRPFISCEIRHYEPSRIEEARAWLTSASETQAA
jgi:hypothetical protein